MDSGNTELCCDNKPGQMKRPDELRRIAYRNYKGLTVRIYYCPLQLLPAMCIFQQNNIGSLCNTRQVKQMKMIAGIVVIFPRLDFYYGINRMRIR